MYWWLCWIISSLKDASDQSSFASFFRSCVEDALLPTMQLVGMFTPPLTSCDPLCVRVFVCTYLLLYELRWTLVVLWCADVWINTVWKRLVYCFGVQLKLSQSILPAAYLGCNNGLETVETMLSFFEASIPQTLNMSNIRGGSSCLSFSSLYKTKLYVHSLLYCQNDKWKLFLLCYMYSMLDGYVGLRRGLPESKGI